MFQNLIQRSAVPPPETNSPFWWGDQAKALTAALCDVNLQSASDYFCGHHTISLLSFPPEASYCSSRDHLSPQTSYLWPDNLLTKSDLSLKSRFNICLSLLPELSI